MLSSTSDVSILHNDAYQFSMLYSHFKNKHTSTVVTAEAYFRKWPFDEHTPVVMAGAYRIKQLLQSFQNDIRKSLHFSGDNSPLSYMCEQILHLNAEEENTFVQWCTEELTKDIAACQVLCASDGEFLLPNFPVVQVTGPVGAVHLLETAVLSILNSSVRAATIANRLRTTTDNIQSGIKLIDFSTRRTDPSAAVHTAVAACIGGFDSTSNVEAGYRYAVPVSGTMAHSYVMSYGMKGELEAFKNFMSVYTETHVLLVDTFDVEQGLANAIRASYETHIPLNAVRLDSGDLKKLLPFVRKQLDTFGCNSTKIVISGDIDEAKLKDLGVGYLSYVNVIGVGSRLGAPDFSMGFVYKFVEVNEKPVHKVSETKEKASMPHKKAWLFSQSQTTIGHHLIPASESGSLSHLKSVLREISEIPNVDFIREAREIRASRLKVEGLVASISPSLTTPLK